MFGGCVYTSYHDTNIYAMPSQGFLIITFLVLNIILMNLLIAMMASTYQVPLSPNPLPPLPPPHTHAAAYLS